MDPKLMAPTFRAAAISTPLGPRFRLRCKWCGQDHIHDAREGWHEAGCEVESWTPFRSSGYYLVAQREDASAAMFEAGRGRFFKRGFAVLPESAICNLRAALISASSKSDAPNSGDAAFAGAPVHVGAHADEIVKSLARSGNLDLLQLVEEDCGVTKGYAAVQLIELFGRRFDNWAVHRIAAEINAVYARGGAKGEGRR
jgi:hypothetical protein